MNDDTWPAVALLFLGVLTGFLLGAGMVSVQANEGRTECELNLPRTEQCINVLVPQTKELK